ncbi:MAG: restriction endonuclease subunit S [Opitutaceae bacterium]|nr:restriction endonuclease subunit S [Opitutaceae bacterium]
MKCWHVKRLGDLVEIRSGTSPSEYTLRSEGTIPYLKVEDLNLANKFLFES